MGPYLNIYTISLRFIDRHGALRNSIVEAGVRQTMSVDWIVRSSLQGSFDLFLGRGRLVFHKP